MPIHKQVRQKVHAAESDSGVVSDDSVTRMTFDCGTSLRKFVGNRWLSGVIEAFADGLYEVTLEAPDGLVNTLIPEEEMEDLVQLALVRVGAKIFIQQPENPKPMEATVTGERLFQTKSFFLEYQNGKEEWIDLSQTKFTLHVRTEIRRIMRDKHESTTTTLSKANKLGKKQLQNDSVEPNPSRPSSATTAATATTSTALSSAKKKTKESKEKDTTGDEKSRTNATELLKMVDEDSYIEIYWPDEKKYHRAKVGKITGRKYHLYYVDEDAHEWVKLSNHIFRIIDEPSDIDHTSDEEEQHANIPLHSGVASTEVAPETSHQPGKPIAESSSGEKNDTINELELKLADVEVGSRVAVYWDGEDRYFQGTVTDIRRNRYHIDYDDGENTWENLENTQFLLINDESISPRTKKRKVAGERSRDPNRASKGARNSIESEENTRQHKSGGSSDNSRTKQFKQPRRGPEKNRNDKGEEDNSSLDLVDSEDEDSQERQRSGYRTKPLNDVNTISRVFHRPQKSSESINHPKLGGSSSKRGPGRSRTSNAITETSSLKRGSAHVVMTEGTQITIPLPRKRDPARQSDMENETAPKAIKNNNGIKRLAGHGNAQGKPSKSSEKHLHLNKDLRNSSTTNSSSGRELSDHEIISKPLSILDDFPVGTRVDVYWPLDARYYRATVSKIDMGRKRPYFLQYEDGEEEWVNFNEHKHRMVQKPGSDSKVKSTAAVKKSTPSTKPAVPESDDNDEASDDESIYRYNLDIEANSKPGNALKVSKGARVAVWWPDDRTYYVGTVKKVRNFLDCKKPHRIVYDDGENEWVDLQDHKFREMNKGASVREPSRDDSGDDSE